MANKQNEAPKDRVLTLVFGETGGIRVGLLDGKPVDAKFAVAMFGSAKGFLLSPLDNPVDISGLLDYLNVLKRLVGEAQVQVLLQQVADEVVPALVAAYAARFAAEAPPQTSAEGEPVQGELLAELLDAETSRN